MSLETFNQLKAKFTEKEQLVIAIQAELTKNGNILEALKTELDELIKQHKVKLAETGEINVDEYVGLKNEDAGYKARIEYYQAQKVELELKLYQAKEELYFIHQDLNNAKSRCLHQKANLLLNSLFTEKEAEFNKTYNYLIHSNEIEINQINNETKEQAVMRYLFEQIEKRINKDAKLDDSFIISNELLAGFAPKSPAQKQKESIQQSPKGFYALFQNLTNN